MEEKTVGGKAYNLDILTKNGINIPKWFVVTSTKDNFEVQDDKLYAVRSSAVGEDGSGNSFRCATGLLYAAAGCYLFRDPPDKAKGTSRKSA